MNFKIFILITIFCTQCNTSTQRFILKNDISSIVDSFTMEFPDYKIYELYINKLDPHNGILVLFAGEESLTAEENMYQNQESLIQIKSNNRIVDIYTGLERYIDSNKRKDSSLRESEINKSLNNQYWIIKDSLNTLTVIKDYGGVYPFMPLLKKTIDLETTGL